MWSRPRACGLSRAPRGLCRRSAALRRLWLLRCLWTSGRVPTWLRRLSGSGRSPSGPPAPGAVDSCDLHLPDGLLWPACAWRRGHSGVLSPVVAAGVATSLVGLLALFVVELQGLTPDSGAATGLAERALAGAQALWPLVVVVALRSGRTDSARSSAS